MDKEELLQELSAKITSGEILREEITSRLQLATPATPPVVDQKNKRHFSITNMLYVLGAAIVIVGVITFFSQIWHDIGSLSRIVATLGLGLLLAGIGSMLLTQKPENAIGPTFHFIGGMLLPIGVVVTLSELDASNHWVITIPFASFFAFYLFLSLFHKHFILTLFAIAQGTATLYLVLNAIVIEHFILTDTWYVYQYLTVAIGASYLLLAHTFRNDWNKNLAGALMLFGSGGFLLAAFSLVFDSVAWEIVFFLIVIGGSLVSVYLKSRNVLIMSTLFLLVHVAHITSEYFADSIGWPISLMILGFVFIGLGYISVAINKKYITEAQI